MRNLLSSSHQVRKQFSSWKILSAFDKKWHQFLLANFPFRPANPKTSPHSIQHRLLYFNKSLIFSPHESHNPHFIWNSVTEERVQFCYLLMRWTFDPKFIFNLFPCNLERNLNRHTKSLSYKIFKFNHLGNCSNPSWEGWDTRSVSK